MIRRNPYEQPSLTARNLSAFIDLDSPLGFPDGDEYPVSFRVNVAYDLDEGKARLRTAAEHSVIDATMSVCHIDMQVPLLQQDELFRKWLMDPKNVIDLEDRVQAYADARLDDIEESLRCGDDY